MDSSKKTFFARLKNFFGVEIWDAKHTEKGGIAGAWMLGKLSSKLITRIFAVVMLAAGIKLLFF